jgi:catalase (peroxidase I)
VADVIVLAGNLGVEQAAKAAGVNVRLPLNFGALSLGCHAAFLR